MKRHILEFSPKAKLAVTSLMYLNELMHYNFLPSPSSVPLGSKIVPSSGIWNKPVKLCILAGHYGPVSYHLRLNMFVVRHGSWIPFCS